MPGNRVSVRFRASLRCRDSRPVSRREERVAMTMAAIPAASVTAQPANPAAIRHSAASQGVSVASFACG
jgi:hypothetical protein